MIFSGLIVSAVKKPALEHTVPKEKGKLEGLVGVGGVTDQPSRYSGKQNADSSSFGPGRDTPNLHKVVGVAFWAVEVGGAAVFKHSRAPVFDPQLWDSHSL